LAGRGPVRLGPEPVVPGVRGAHVAAGRRPRPGPGKLAGGRPGDPGPLARGQRADHEEGDAVRCARAVGAARLARDDRAGPGRTVLINERALQDVDDLLAAVLVQTRQLESGGPLDRRPVQVVIQPQHLAPTGRSLRLPLDVTLGQIIYARG